MLAHSLEFHLENFLPWGQFLGPAHGCHDVEGLLATANVVPGSAGSGAVHNGTVAAHLVIAVKGGVTATLVSRSQATRTPR